MELDLEVFVDPLFGGSREVDVGGKGLLLEQVGELIGGLFGELR